ncbi:MAG: PKD domain-containing protein [Bacteroidetes bacterium]|nr:PKD domain-containing protein [Bacteroidota bacterium]
MFIQLLRSPLQAGDYPVVLTATATNGCIDTMTDTIHIGPPATTYFHIDDDTICANSGVVLTDSSSIANGETVIRRTWDFGDGQSDSLLTTISHTYATAGTYQNPMNQYTDTGNYSVALTVSDNNGCSDTISKTIIVYPNPTVYFTTSKACTYNEITFTDSSTISSTQIIDWTWNFSDGTIVGGVQNPQHIFSQSAAYPVQLIATTNQGCRDSIIKLIAVDESPEFQLLDSKACFGNPNSFNFSPLGSVVTNPGYNWDFGDSTSSLQAQPSHTYTFSGLKTVILTYTNLNNGCSLNDTLIAEVIPNPVSDFITDSTCVGDTISLNGQQQFGLSIPSINGNEICQIFRFRQPCKINLRLPQQQGFYCSIEVIKQLRL